MLDVDSEQSGSAFVDESPPPTPPSEKEPPAPSRVAPKSVPQWAPAGAPSNTELLETAPEAEPERDEIAEQLLALQEERRDLEEELATLSQMREQLRQREAEVSSRLNQISAEEDVLRPRETTIEAIQAYIASSYGVRVEKARREQELIALGARPGELVRRRAPIDEAMARSVRRGSDRPKFPKL